VNVLYSIESQDLSKKDLSNLEVIVIDDGSTNPVFKLIEPHFKNYSFKPKIIRLEQNQGLSVARNMGYQLSTFENILFIDSDILLAKNYLYEHSIRLQMIPNSLFISFKENIFPDSKLNNLEQIKKGLPVSNDLNDKRIYRSIEKDTRWPNKTVDEGTEELLSETNLFKNFGYGRTINGCFDLPSMVVGHNMSMRKEIVKSAGDFSNNFSGWGLEDTYFGAKVIANGNFIIPVLTTNVYHIDHPSRSGSPEKQLIEYKKNTKIYNDLIRQKL
jgi:glycosyltransferase involved in cell wall biosynthesis